MVWSGRRLLMWPLGSSARMRSGFLRAGWEQVSSMGLKKRTRAPERCQPRAESSFLLRKPARETPLMESLFLGVSPWRMIMIRFGIEFSFAGLRELSVGQGCDRYNSDFDVNSFCSFARCGF